MIKKMKRMNQSREIGSGSTKVLKKIMCSGIFEQSNIFSFLERCRRPFTHYYSSIMNFSIKNIIWSDGFTVDQL